jgi:sirohydrochlorin ferrochelatase
MAHGGDDEWNGAVTAAVDPIRRVMPTAVAFGMADPATLEAALDSLEDLGVERVAVVRMFLSGASFIAQTEYLLGLSDEQPAFFIPGHVAAHGGPAADPDPLDHPFGLVTHEHGIVDSDQVGAIVAERAFAISTDPEQESVLLLAHGMGSEELNDQLVAALADFEALIGARPFAAIRSATLREDWAEARAVAEEEIRTFVRGENDRGKRVIVVPVRLSGFGPYAEVLEGLDYVAAESLLPDERVTDWIAQVACELLCAHGWPSPLMAMMQVDRDLLRAN